ncbi:hypothetical protein IQ22_03916 [Pseudomonas duriflava]|uniref:Uncharacterized protein n=1 Tax=Pseudomonas duriflava TaxID=459528 RepID=A0A562PYX2_9PSED|nr:hypothetical protein [Pseudomonas duriflava]TWI49593.1 hypothetical protein IQ22_03916 [Pseudomonas duriflava]
MTQIDAEQKPGRKLGFIGTWLLVQLVFLVIAGVWVAIGTMVGDGYRVTNLALFGLCALPPTSFLALWGVRAALGGRIAKLIFGLISTAAVIGAVWFSKHDTVLMASVVWLVTAVPFFLISALVKLIREKEQAFAERRAKRLQRCVCSYEEADEYVWLGQTTTNGTNQAIRDLRKFQEHVEQQMIHDSVPGTQHPTWL